MKYMGSKSRIAKYIVPIIQESIDKNNITNYLEPFCGGANIIDKVKCDNKIGHDLNKYLIALLNRVKNGGDLLESVSRELYNDVRKNIDNNKYENWLIGNVGFLASYNGRWFDGGYANSLYEKTKYGLRLRDYYNEAKNNLLNQYDSLLNISFEQKDYIDIKKDISGHLIYCDPPYSDVKKYSNSINFDHDQFWRWCRDMSKRNIVIISEENAPEDFICIWEKEISRTIKVSDKSKSTEKLFIYKT